MKTNSMTKHFSTIRHILTTLTNNFDMSGSIKRFIRNNKLKIGIFILGLYGGQNTQAQLSKKIIGCYVIQHRNEKFGATDIMLTDRLNTHPLQNDLISARYGRIIDYFSAGLSVNYSNTSNGMKAGPYIRFFPLNYYFISIFSEVNYQFDFSTKHQKELSIAGGVILYTRTFGIDFSYHYTQYSKVSKSLGLRPVIGLHYYIHLNPQNNIKNIIQKNYMKNCERCRE